ncbi:hypothetical protein SKAU_G00260330 [Synaphobranchus kaupii]|uniref:Uncharacterized protein n=1 Tax=Synaphobranchus kaupii TaxID=118154 RepID=A0A9Q1ISH0_SYNKA|nr:hypothetical protein SKAU_G00260330 [Synaphobranchus kaupii]
MQPLAVKSPQTLKYRLANPINAMYKQALNPISSNLLLHRAGPTSPLFIRPIKRLLLRKDERALCCCGEFRENGSQRSRAVAVHVTPHSAKRGEETGNALLPYLRREHHGLLCLLGRFINAWHTLIRSPGSGVYVSVC